MALTVDEVMNPEVFRIGAKDTVRQALDGLLAMGITGAPVLDDNSHPLGVLSLRDLVGGKEGQTAGERMTTPALVIRAGAQIADAARLIAESGYRRLVVVDDEGRVVGMLSALDVIRALLGLPTRHPSTFPHLDPQSGLIWTDDTLLELDLADVAPEGPGVLALILGGEGKPERLVWVETPHNLRNRVVDIISLPQDNPELARLLQYRQRLRFRTASTTDPKIRDRVRDALRAQIRHMLAAGDPPEHGPHHVH